MRLIDADELKNYFKCDDLPNLFQDILLEAVDLQPTAYDIDKVVQELENKKYRILLEKQMDDVIDIVKRGGLNVGSEN